MIAGLLGLRRLAQKLGGAAYRPRGVGVDRQPTSPDSAEAVIKVTLEAKCFELRIKPITQTLMLSGKEWPTGIWSSLVNLPFGFLDQSELAPLSRPSSGGLFFFALLLKRIIFSGYFSQRLAISRLSPLLVKYLKEISLRKPVFLREPEIFIFWFGELQKDNLVMEWCEMASTLHST
ncbi:hypothetical protein HED63_20255 [Ochrobactrum cytisi]|nr:hypothetical protein [Brucella cytisi]